MSKIDELLKNEKVEWKKLEEVCEFQRGQAITKKDIIDGKIPVIAGGKKPAYYHGISNRNGITIAVAGSGAYAGFVSYWEQPIFLSDAFSVEPNESLNKRYLYHWLLSVQHKIFELKQGSGIPHVYGKDLGRFEIPIPSIGTQEKIVKILDKFTNYVTELQTELQKRTKQYEYYRDMLLSEEYLNKISAKIDGIKNNEDISFYTLSQVFNTRNGYTPSKSVKEYWNSEDIPWFKMEDIRENGNILSYAKNYVSNSAIKGEPFEQNSIILSTSATIGEHALITVPFLANQRFTCFSLKGSYKKEVNIKYAYYYFYIINKWCRNNIKIGNFPSVDVSTLLTQTIPIPDIYIQNKVVEILDKFQSLLSDTKGLLPHEIEQRQKQYEYYREKLLTFDENCVKRERERERAYLSNSYLDSLKEAGELVGVKLYNIEWERLEDLLDYEQPSKYIVKTTNYSNDYNVPVLTAGQTFVLGFTDEEENTYKASKQNPVIIFDDFTAGNHWVDFDFKVKSSAMKMIKSNGNINLRYCYHYMQTIKIDSMEHKRLWISKYSQIKIPVPSIKVQEHIVSILDKFDSIVNDISKGLPKEIELRQKQYEYYREKLLSFDR